MMKEYKPAEKLKIKGLEKDFPKNFSKKTQKIHCPSCEAGINAADLNLQNSVAKCSNCNIVFSIEEELESVKTQEQTKQELSRPEGIDFIYHKDELDIITQQNIQGMDIWGMMLTPLFALLSILIFFDKGIPIYYPMIFTLWMSYYIYKGFNYSNYKIYIEIKEQLLNVKFRPKNFKKDKSYLIEEIEQLYVKQSHDAPGYYAVFMIINGTDGQKHEKLVNVNTLSKAKYLEQEIERYLNIEDRDVPEEMA